MFEIKNDSIVADYIVNSKHTMSCSSKEFQIPEECNCWRVEFTKSILAKQEMKKGIYVASKVKFAPIWKKFRSEGYPIVSSWLDEADKTDSNMVELWKKNIEESSSCGVLVYFAEDPVGIKSKKETVSNGGLVEVGSALSNDIPVIWAAMNYPTVCKHPNVQFVNGCEDVDPEFEIKLALNEAMKILKLAVPNKITQPTPLAQVYLNFIQTKFNKPNYNFTICGHDQFEKWKKEQTLENIKKYLAYFSKWYPAKVTDNKFYLDIQGNEYYTDKIQGEVSSRKWWEALEDLRCELSNKIQNLNACYTWDSFVHWCFTDETPRKEFRVGLKEKDNIHEQTVASIPSIKCKDAKELSVEITGLSLVKDSTNPIIKTVSTVTSSKARKLNRIKTHSSLVRCTNKSRRTISLFPTQVTCGHCLKLGKKKGLWV